MGFIPNDGSGGITTISTTTPTTLTTGSILFAKSGFIAQDNANFFWDDTNNRLGLGTSSPTSPLHVVSPNSTTVPELIKGASGQTADLTRWQDNSSTTLAKIDRLGGGFFSDIFIQNSGISSNFAFRFDGYADYFYMVAGDSGSGILFRTGGEYDRVWINGDGTVAIGENGLSSPNELFYVEGSGASDGRVATFNANGASGSTDSYITTGALAVDGGAYFRYEGGSNTAHFGIHGHGAGVIMDSSGNMKPTGNYLSAGGNGGVSVAFTFYDTVDAVDKTATFENGILTSLV